MCDAEYTDVRTGVRFPPPEEDHAPSEEEQQAAQARLTDAIVDLLIGSLAGESR